MHWLVRGRQPRWNRFGHWTLVWVDGWLYWKLKYHKIVAVSNTSNAHMRLKMLDDVSTVCTVSQILCKYNFVHARYFSERIGVYPFMWSLVGIVWRKYVPYVWNLFKLSHRGVEMFAYFLQTLQILWFRSARSSRLYQVIQQTALDSPSATVTLSLHRLKELSRFSVSQDLSGGGMSPSIWRGPVSWLYVMCKLNIIKVIIHCGLCVGVYHTGSCF